MVKTISNPFNNSWFNPFYRPAVALKAEAGIRLGLHIGTNFLAKTNGRNTAAKVAAFAADLFTAIPCSLLALLYNILTLAPLRNKFIQISNHVLREQDKAARQSWKPISYRALAIDALLLATIAVVGYKYFFPTIDKTPKPSDQPTTPPEIVPPTPQKPIDISPEIPSRSWTKAALAIGGTVVGGAAISLACCCPSRKLHALIKNDDQLTAGTLWEKKARAFFITSRIADDILMAKGNVSPVEGGDSSPEPQKPPEPAPPPPS